VKVKGFNVPDKTLKDAPPISRPLVEGEGEPINSPLKIERRFVDRAWLNLPAVGLRVNEVSKKAIDEEPCTVITSVLYDNMRVPLGLNQAFATKSYPLCQRPLHQALIDH
jgi:hypothetical protein